MINDQRYFLKALEDHLAKKHTVNMNGLDWSLIMHWAKIHGLEGIIYYQCCNDMPVDIRTSFEKSLGATIFYYKKREAVLKHIKEEFEHRNISFITFKGIEVSRCYPVPQLRTMGDLDILVHEDEKKIAGKALEAMGFTALETPPDFEWVYSYEGMIFELHHNLIYKKETTIKQHEVFFNNCWEYVVGDRLDWNFHLLFILEHLRKHFMNNGVGIRMFLDIAAVIRSKSDLNWLWIENKLSELNLLRFAKVCFALIESWFGIMAPIKYETLDMAMLEQITSNIFSNGVFGFNNINNQYNGTTNFFISSKKSGFVKRVNLFIKLMFPSYRTMANSPYYSFVKDRIWLLPIAWGYRILRLLGGKTLNVSYYIKQVTAPNEMIDKRMDELNKLGLYDDRSRQ